MLKSSQGFRSRLPIWQRNPRPAPWLSASLLLPVRRLRAAGRVRRQRNEKRRGARPAFPARPPKGTLIPGGVEIHRVFAERRNHDLSAHERAGLGLLTRSVDD